MILLQVLVDLIFWAIDHWKEVTLFGVINFVAVALGKRIGMRQLQRLFGLGNETKHYVANQARIESKIDLLLEEKGLIWNGSIETSCDGAAKNSKASLPILQGISHRGILRRRTQRMREYLKKLGRTKFQAFLVTTITNIIMLVGYFLNWQDIQSRVNEWMPAVNIGVQAIATFTYIWVEGSIDQTTAANGGQNDAQYPTDTDHSV